MTALWTDACPDTSYRQRLPYRVLRTVTSDGDTAAFGRTKRMPGDVAKSLIVRRSGSSTTTRWLVSPAFGAWTLDEQAPLESASRTRTRFMICSEYGCMTPHTAEPEPDGER